VYRGLNLANWRRILFRQLADSKAAASWLKSRTLSDQLGILEAILIRSELQGEKYNRSAMRNRAEIQCNPLTGLRNAKNLETTGNNGRNNEDATKEAMGIA
jgi:hypothetical protein